MRPQSSWAWITLGDGHMSRTSIALLSIFALSAAHAQQDDDAAAINQFYAALEAAAQAADIPAYTSLFVADALMFVPNRPPLRGRTAIGDWFSIYSQSPWRLEIDSTTRLKTDVLGEVAMISSRTTGDYVNRDTGERLSFDQKYLDVLRYEDGGWLLMYHVASSTRFDDGFWDLDWESE
jgi:uncharacterized protein (TIGR02246 family)